MADNELSLVIESKDNAQLNGKEAMGLGSNTYAAATLTSHIKRESLKQYLLTTFNLPFNN